MIEIALKARTDAERGGMSSLDRGRNRPDVVSESTEARSVGEKAGDQPIARSGCAT